MEFCFEDVQDNVLILRASGRLDSRTGAAFRQSIGKMVQVRLWNIIVDCSEVDHLSPYGLAILARLHRQMDEKLGDVKIASARGWTVVLLRRTGLGGFFKLYPDVQSARKAFKKVKKTPLIFR